MSATTHKSKKPRTKPPRSRPQSVSAISQPIVHTSNVKSDVEASPIKEKIDPAGVFNKRYTEPSSLQIRSGVELGQDISADDLASQNIDGHLDVDLAELSLGQRLTAISGDRTDELLGSSETEEDGGHPQIRNGKAKTDKGVVPPNSLTRTLIQALHSSDSRLLETCLAHSDPALIRNTVRRLPPQLAVPLLTACVERLSRGARAGNMKGGGGGASSQRGTGLITWVKTVLTIHSGHLMTMPDLVARLSGLHATLTSRLALQESLLSLSGRLDMVLSQIELRSSNAPAPLTAAPKIKQPKAPKNSTTNRYVEGESEEEDEMEVDVENDDDGGSVEDIEFGQDHDETDEDDDEGSDDEDDDEGDEGGLMLNGFIDDEAEEFDEDEEDDVNE